MKRLPGYLLALFVMAAVLVPINVWDQTALGDAFREGRVKWAVILLAPMFALAAARYVNAFLCALWAWQAILWAWWGMDSYGYQEVLLPLIFVFGAKCLVELDYNIVLRCLRISFSFQALLGILQAMKWIPSFWGDHWRPDGALGTIGQETLLGSFLAPLVIVALFHWSVWEALLGLACCILCDSSMTMAALGGSAVVMVWKKISLRAGLALSALGASALALGWAIKPFDNSFFNTSGRSPVWAIALEYASKLPLGWGPGAWKGLYAHFRIPSGLGSWPQLHSEFISLRFELGWPGLILGAIGLVGAVVFTKNPMKGAIIAGLTVNSLGNSTWHFPVSAFLMCIALSLPEHEED